MALVSLPLEVLASFLPRLSMRAVCMQFHKMFPTVWHLQDLSHVGAVETLDGMASVCELIYLMMIRVEPRHTLFRFHPSAMRTALAFLSATHAPTSQFPALMHPRYCIGKRLFSRIAKLARCGGAPLTTRPLSCWQVEAVQCICDFASLQTSRLEGPGAPLGYKQGIRLLICRM